MKCPGCGIPRDEAWPSRPEQAAEFEARFEAEALMCAACDKIDRAKQEFSKAKAAHGGTYFVVRDVTREPLPTPPNGRPDAATPGDPR